VLTEQLLFFCRFDCDIAYGVVARGGLWCKKGVKCQTEEQKNPDDVFKDLLSSR
jgi:hypothetical protein